MKALDFKLKILVLSWKKEKKDKTMLIEHTVITLTVNPILHTSVFLSQNRSMFLTLRKDYRNLSYKSECKGFFIAASDDYHQHLLFAVLVSSN